MNLNKCCPIPHLCCCDISMVKTLRIQLFGRLVRLLNTRELNLPYAAHVYELRNGLLTTYPQLRDQAFSIAVNQEVAREDTPIPPDAVIALLPPYSGG